MMLDMLERYAVVLSRKCSTRPHRRSSARAIWWAHCAGYEFLLMSCFPGHQDGTYLLPLRSESDFRSHNRRWSVHDWRRRPHRNGRCCNGVSRWRRAGRIDLVGGLPIRHSRRRGSSRRRPSILRRCNAALTIGSARAGCTIRDSHRRLLAEQGV